MAVDFHSSFIPKEPVTEAVFKKKKAGILGTLAVTFFIVSILASAGVYFYKGMVEGNIAELQSELAMAETNIDKETITEMSRFASRLSLVKSIIMKHKAVSGVLNAVASSTVSSVYFPGFGYDSVVSDNLSVSLKGRATSYGTVALQEDVFKKSKDFTSVEISNLQLEEGGYVSFDARVSVDPRITVFEGDPALSISEAVADTLEEDIDLENISELDELDAEINNIDNL